MQHDNVYYDVNENPNIFPPSKSYVPQTHVPSNLGLQPHQQPNFRQIATQQNDHQNRMFLQSGGQPNFTNSNYAGINSGLSDSRESRASHSQQQSQQPQQPQQSYADLLNTNATGNVNPQNRGQTQHIQGVHPSNMLSDPTSILQINDNNNHAMTEQAYPHVYMPRPFYQLPQKNLINDPDPNYLSIDSEDRDRTKFANPNMYTIPFVTSDTSGQGNVPGRRYKNVASIELISGVIPNRANVLDEIYLILQIDEIEDTTYDASNHNLARGFAKLLFAPCDGTSKWLRLDTDLSDPLYKVFYPKPIASLDRFTIRLLKRDGTPFDFGTDNSLPADVNPDLQNSWTFKITQKVVDVTPLGQRNV